MKSFEKVKLTCILDDVGRLRKINVQVTVKAKALSCWIFENVPNENCSLFTEKKTKSRRENEPKNPPTKEETRRRKKNSGWSLRFYVDFFGESCRKKKTV